MTNEERIELLEKRVDALTNDIQNVQRTNTSSIKNLFEIVKKLLNR